MQDYGRTRSGSEGAQEALQDQAQRVTEKAREVGGTVQDSVREQVDARSTQAGEQVGSVSEAMRSMGEQLRGQGNDLPAQLAQQAADRVEQLGRYLREADADQILSDVEDFGRRQPWVVAALGLAAGLAAARFIKASGRRRYQSGGRPPLTTPPYGSSTTYGTSAYGTPAEVTTPVNEREEDVYPLRGGS
jgi:hypothetical protein